MPDSLQHIFGVRLIFFLSWLCIYFAISAVYLLTCLCYNCRLVASQRSSTPIIGIYVFESFSDHILSLRLVILLQRSPPMPPIANRLGRHGIWCSENLNSFVWGCKYLIKFARPFVRLMYTWEVKRRLIVDGCVIQPCHFLLIVASCATAVLRYVVRLSPTVLPVQLSFSLVLNNKNPMSGTM
jgi:hypothetical protein